MENIVALRIIVIWEISYLSGYPYYFNRWNSNQYDTFPEFYKNWNSLCFCVTFGRLQIVFYLLFRERDRERKFYIFVIFIENIKIQMY